jgi:DNA-3-methyladenine glycosylase I
MDRPRCWKTENPLYIAYHDTEWGVPVPDDRVLFEFLILEGLQAGLSWETVLRKREHYREALSGFDPVLVAAYDERAYEALMQHPSLIRNKLKMRAIITNAKRFLEVQREFGSFDAYVWRFVGGNPIRRNPHTLSDVPATSLEAQALSADLKGRGFSFVGPVVCYSFMQAVGLVNDHLVTCFRHGEL